MSDVVSINPVKTGDTTFMCCPCTPEPTPFIVVAIADPRKPIICSLLCPECEHEIPVTNGIVGAV